MGMLTGAALHCGPWPTGFSPVLGWSVMAVKPVEAGGLTGLRRDWTFDKKISKHHFLTSCSKFNKIWNKFLQE
jgi:hypothetical protein